MTTLLRTIRKNRHQTLQEAADLFGTNVGNMSRIEQGKQMPRITLARRIAVEYELTLDEVYGAEGVRIKPAECRYMPFNPGAVSYDLYVDVTHEPAS